LGAPVGETIWVMGLVDSDWKPVPTEVNIRRDTVEFRAGDRLVGIVDREAFKNWLLVPVQALVFDEMAWQWDDFLNRVLLRIKDLVSWWPLDDEDLATLRSIV
jgi:hypothetical protein